MLPNAVLIPNQTGHPTLGPDSVILEFCHQKLVAAQYNGTSSVTVLTCHKFTALDLILQVALQHGSLGVDGCCSLADGQIGGVSDSENVGLLGVLQGVFVYRHKSSRVRQTRVLDERGCNVGGNCMQQILLLSHFGFSRLEECGFGGLVDSHQVGVEHSLHTPAIRDSLEFVGVLRDAEQDWRG